MPVSVSLDPLTFARLQGLAEPLVDTIDTVINRALDALDAAGAAPADGGDEPILDPAAPPSLTYTTVRGIVFEGERLPPRETYWNALMLACIREAGRRGRGPEAVQAITLAPTVPGCREDGGYTHVPEAGISVQGQDANAAWRAAHHVAVRLGLRAEVAFVWQANPKAAHPGRTGTLTIGGRRADPARTGRDGEAGDAVRA